MTGNHRERLIFHGAVVLFVGLLCGYPAVIAAMGDQALRGWRSAHLELIVLGTWLLATAAVLPALVLGRRETSALFWSLLGAAYGLMTALLVRAATGVHGFSPAGPPANAVAFAGGAAGILGSLLATLLTMSGARAALRRRPVE